MHRYLFVFISFLLVHSAQAALLIDQQQTNTSGGIAGDGISRIALQSFKPSVDNIAGVDVDIIGTAVITETVSVFLFSDSGLGQLLASDTIVDHPRNTLAEFRWAPVALIPEETYFFQFLTGSLNVGLTGGTNDPYPRGQFTINGSDGGNFLDANFTTYYDDEFVVPIPAAIYLLMTSLAVLLGFTRQN